MRVIGKEGKRDWEGGKGREGKVKGVGPHPKQKSGCATVQLSVEHIH